MDWLQLNTADVLAEFTPAEQKTLENIQASTASLGVIVGDVAAEFRQAITDSGVDISSTASGFIPPGFRAHGNALARWRWLISFPQARAMQTAERKAAAEKAETLIEAIANSDRPVAAPDALTSGRSGISHVSADQEHPFGQLGTT